MIIKNIELENFRNYRSGTCFFDPHVNVITGSNAQGKTNLLEAVYYLSGARSFRTRSDKDIINLDSDSLR
jgi:DNA replication and repair protein RecF